MNPEGSEEQDILDMSRLANGHDSALNELMERHAQKLYHYLLRSLQNEEDASDLAQEIFVKVYQNRTKFDQNQKFTTWLYAISSNLVRDRYRWRSRHLQVSLDAENEEIGATLKDNLQTTEAAPDEQLLSDERASAVRRGIATLPDKLREPLILAVYQGMSQADIAAILKCSIKAVEIRIYRARQQLRAALADLAQP